MARYKKSFGVMALAAAAAGAGIVGSGLVKDVKYAHARDARDEARQQLAAADVGQLGAVYRNVGKVMEPSVVQIEVRKVAQTGRRSLPFDDDTLRKFFKDRNGDGQPDIPEGFGPGAGGEDAPLESVGTG